MKKILLLSCAVVLTAIFFISGSSSVSAERFDPLKEWEHEIIVERCKFSNEQVDLSYDFSKLKRVFIPDTDTSEIKNHDIKNDLLAEANNAYVKKMKCKSVDKYLADAWVEIKIKEWTSEFDHREPERMVYEAYEHYEGWEEFEVRPPPPPRRDDKHRHNPPPRHRPPPPRKERRWKVSDTWFPGSQRVVTAEEHSNSRKITRSEPFANSKKVVYPAHYVYRSKVVALFEVRDAKSNKVVMSREGNVAYLERGYQFKLYAGLCHSFFKNFKKVIKKAKKAKS